MIRSEAMPMGRQQEWLGLVSARSVPVIAFSELSLRVIANFGDGGARSGGGVPVNLDVTENEFWQLRNA